jgi:hypothetical protein
MSRLASNSMLLLLSVLAGFAWALVYPFAGLGVAGDVLWLVLAVSCFAVLRFARSSVQLLAILAAVASAIAGFLTMVWSAAAWHLGFWFPKLPPILHRLFSADGEASYNASDGELFIVLFLFFLVLLFVVPLFRQAFCFVFTVGHKVVHHDNGT